MTSARASTRSTPRTWFKVRQAITTSWVSPHRESFPGPAAHVSHIITANPARLGSVITLYVNGVPDVNDSLRVFLYSPEPAEIIGVERYAAGMLAIRARLPPLPYPDHLGVQVCAGGVCSRPIDPQPMAWWQYLDPRGVSLYLSTPK